MAAAVEFKNITVKYGSVVALDGVSLEVELGELFFLRGPSGCGKTTLLRAIAGFVKPDAGEVLFDGNPVNDLPPYARNTGMVFQNYALWPHMTVAENVAYGLRVRGVDKESRTKRIARVLSMVGLSQYGTRRPAELSGGQQQRVALARALVIEPRVVLLDEPLSNLDAKLRAEMRVELRELIKAAGLTGIYVTHDQTEALTMADRVAVLRDGKIVQINGPRELYDAPLSEFVGTFVGDANVVEGTISSLTRDSTTISTPLGSAKLLDAPRLPEGNAVRVLFRPEEVRMTSGDGKGLSFEAEVKHVSFGGDSQGVTVVVGGKVEVRLKLYAPLRPIREGRSLKLSVPRECIRVYGPEGTMLAEPDGEGADAR